MAPSLTVKIVKGSGPGMPCRVTLYIEAALLSAVLNCCSKETHDLCGLVHVLSFSQTTRKQQRDTCHSFVRGGDGRGRSSTILQTNHPKK